MTELGTRRLTRATEEPARTRLSLVAQAGLVRRPKDIRAVQRYAALLGTITGVDAISVHVYPRARRLDEASDLLTHSRNAVRANDPQLRPVWITEVNVSRATTLGKRQQASAVTAITEPMQRAGFARAYWYSWTSEGAPGLIPLDARTPAGEALQEQLASPT